jgi:hypothetical protein
METLQFLFGIATATIFTFTAGLVRTFFCYPFHPYGSAVMTSRWLRTHHITTVALVAFSFLVFALLPAGTGFSGGDALKKIWQTDKSQVELLYLVLFVLGSTVLTVIGGVLFQKLLVITKRNRQLFTDIYNAFVAFTLLWFVLLAALTYYVFDLSGASTRLDTWQFKIELATALTKLKFSDVSDLFFSPAFWVMLGLSGYFGYLMIQRWSLRRGIRNIVRGKDAQKALSRTVIMLSTATVAAFFIVVPALYLALLSSSLLQHASPRVVPRSNFEYLTACYTSGNKLHVTMIVKNNRQSSTALPSIFIDPDKADKAYELDSGDLFWMSKKGFYFDPTEIRYYRLELPAPAMPASARLASKCKTQDEKPSKGSVLVKAVGDSYSVTASSYENKSSKRE